MMIPLGAFEPDRAGLDTGLLTVAKNALPNTVGWGPMPSLSAFGSSALPADCKGLAFARTNVGSYVVFAGTATKLYKLVSGVWTDYTRTVGGDYAVPGAGFWRFAQFGSTFIAVNGADAPQSIDVDSLAVNFAALAGSPPTAMDVSVVGDFVFMLDSADRRRLVWSAFNDPTGWTIGLDLCDEYVAPDGGMIMNAPLLGEYGVFLQDDGVARRVILQPGDPFAAFRFEKIAEGIKAPTSVFGIVAAYGALFYRAQEGPYRIGADGQVTPIGDQRVNTWLRENSDIDRIEQTLAFADPYSPRIYFAFHSSSGAEDYDRLLGYDTQFFAPIVSAGSTLEQVAVTYPNLDTMSVSLDSSQFLGGRPTVGAVTSSGMLAFLSGSNLDATLTLAELEPNPEGRTHVSQVSLKGQFGESAPSLRIGKREFSGGAQSWDGPLTRSPTTGRVYTRASARLLTYELTIPSASWTFAQAIDTKEQADGQQ
jgi:hypothetical protein